MYSNVYFNDCLFLLMIARSLAMYHYQIISWKIRFTYPFPTFKPVALHHIHQILSIQYPGQDIWVRNHVLARHKTCPALCVMGNLRLLEWKRWGSPASEWQHKGTTSIHSHGFCDELLCTREVGSPAKSPPALKDCRKALNRLFLKGKTW